MSQWSTGAKIGVAIAAVALVLGVIFFVVSGRNAQTSEQTGAQVTQTTSAPAAPSDGGGSGASDEGGDLIYDGQQNAGPDEGLPDGSDADKAASSEVAKAAATAWVDHSVGTAEWSERMKGYVTETSWSALNLPAPQRISPTQVTGDPVAQDVSTETAEYFVPTDAGELGVTLVKEGDQWKVSAIDKDL